MKTERKTRKMKAHKRLFKWSDLTPGGEVFYKYRRRGEKLKLKVYEGKIVRTKEQQIQKLLDENPKIDLATIVLC